MVRAWYLESDAGGVKVLSQEDGRMELLGVDELTEKTGLLFWTASRYNRLFSSYCCRTRHEIDVDNIKNIKENETLKKIKQERGYTWEDDIEISKRTLPDFEEKTKAFATEHMHPDEEVRLVLDGTGFFDVRDREDRWIRLQFQKGDMIALPPGMYHRFNLGSDEGYLKLHRIFSTVPQWTAHNRIADD
ncbi:1,2-dihydroxy-3-keto-5-methylthiopentene dioxygenase isoform X1 [Lingula anatina]|uniref:Acireductone dioxygenase n=1 Tax=Lingula anatina TaxID=7574 RepID=A0A1S3HXY6_LINAN|nr:1,2-dihydroxy-3-keto-5-methylthiopentene dioxygenase isoform X1 [Lingula anatina]|eukprot:XP_013390873.1 1,2-dihydroxy-3-keto-5-methylthiopentene dioxygenase isoform X1 [Lingula anatina]